MTETSRRSRPNRVVSFVLAIGFVVSGTYFVYRSSTPEQLTAGGTLVGLGVLSLYGWLFHAETVVRTLRRVRRDRTANLTGALLFLAIGAYNTYNSTGTAQLAVSGVFVMIGVLGLYGWFTAEVQNRV